ncbi:MAG: hypothetical protein PHN72_05860 [Bacilli bacterium]|nr:hypothetical protein [Bacilli bacterium]
MNEKLINDVKKLFSTKELTDNPNCYIYDLEIAKNNIDCVMNYVSKNVKLYYAMDSVK